MPPVTGKQDNLSHSHSNSHFARQFRCFKKEERGALEKQRICDTLNVILRTSFILTPVPATSLKYIIIYMTLFYSRKFVLLGIFSVASC